MKKRLHPRLRAIKKFVAFEGFGKSIDGNLPLFQA
jgi:hypothetical protein